MASLGFWGDEVVNAEVVDGVVGVSGFCRACDWVECGCARTKEL